MKKTIILLALALIACGATAHSRNSSEKKHLPRHAPPQRLLQAKNCLKKAKRLDKVNEDLARHYYKQTAKMGYSEACVVLGNIAYHDNDDDEAILWYDRAASAGNPKGYINHGELFREGEDQNQNFETRYCLKAAALPFAATEVPALPKSSRPLSTTRKVYNN